LNLHPQVILATASGAMPVLLAADSCGSTSRGGPFAGAHARRATAIPLRAERSAGIDNKEPRRARRRPARLDRIGRMPAATLARCQPGIGPLVYGSTQAIAAVAARRRRAGRSGCGAVATLPPRSARTPLA
jgi:hypothetical protein